MNPTVICLPEKTPNSEKHCGVCLVVTVDRNDNSVWINENQVTKMVYVTI